MIGLLLASLIPYTRTYCNYDVILMMKWVKKIYNINFEINGMKKDIDDFVFQVKVVKIIKEFK